MNFAEIQAAIHLFDLSERATLKEIKARYRKLNEANRIILSASKHSTIVQPIPLIGM